MIPPLEMATNKNLRRRVMLSIVLALAAAWGVGCGPPGPRAFRDGRKLLESGDYAGAAEKFRVAAQAIGSNAVVWDYLGVAYHHAGELDAAAGAYQTALRLNKDLVAAHYNLGCALLEQNRGDKLDAARNEFTAYTLRQANSVPGFLKLGETQLRLKDTPGAERSYRQALQLNAESVEAMNGLGLVEWQRSRYRESAAWFTNALAHQPNFAPALLNLAVILQGYLNNRPLALQKYNEYLALTPRPADWQAVSTVARQLEQDLALAAHPATNAAIVATPAPSPHGVPTNTARLETASSNSRGTVAMAARPAPPRETDPPVEIVEIGTASNGGNSAATTGGSAGTEPTVITPADDGTSSRPGFLQRINPFRRPPATVETPAPQPETSANTSPAPADTGSRTVSVPRYSYVSPTKPAEGNLAEAERYFAQAAQAQNDRRLKDAVALYRQATQADPAFFEAQANLGLAAYDLGDMTQSLLAYEMALAIKPESFSARFKFGLALSKAGYIMDAAQELERALAGGSNETAEKQAMAHLALANLYSDQFHRPAAARPHYQKVLELDPNNTQATAIRSWLRANQ